MLAPGSDAPIQYERVQFANNTEDDMTPYQGPSTPETDAAWDKLLDGESSPFPLSCHLRNCKKNGADELQLDQD